MPDQIGIQDSLTAFSALAVLGYSGLFRLVEAHRIMATKNSLSAADAERVERGFQERLASIATEAELSAQKIKSRRKTSMFRAVG